MTTTAEARIAELRELIEMMTGFYDEMEKLETERLVSADDLWQPDRRA